MNNLFKAGLVVSIVIVLAISVTGCTFLNSSPTLLMHAKQDGSDTLYGRAVVRMNVTVFDAHAGNIRITSNNFEMQDSSGAVHQSLGSTSAGVTLSNGDSSVTLMTFYIEPGAHPTEMTYFDGNNKVTCSVA
jgi:hypothetical protein